MPGLADLKIAQSAHCYNPMQLTHYQASWVQRFRPVAGADLAAQIKRRRRLGQRAFAPGRLNRGRQLAQQGVGVHVGEWGAFNRTPHDVVLAWMRDKLERFQGSGIGLGAVEFPRRFWCDGQRPCGRSIRKLARTPPRPQNAGTASGGMNKRSSGDTAHFRYPIFLLKVSRIYRPCEFSSIVSCRTMLSPTIK